MLTHTMLNFGFNPNYDDLDAVLERFSFDRALVVDFPIDGLFDHVAEVRTSVETVAELPAGVYWFTGIADSLVFQVASGPLGSFAEVISDDWNEVSHHPLAEAFNWAESLWANSAALPTPAFEIGARALTIPGGIDVEVKSRRYSGSRWSYSVRGPNGVSNELESSLRAVVTSDDPVDWVLEPPAPAARFGATLTRAKLTGMFADTLYSFGATRTVFMPYQFKPVLKMLSTGQARLLIADEVGLGKTIEAGLIWTELEARREADRVLIVCPSGLVEKWRDEMSERFGFELIELNKGTRDKFLEQHLANSLPSRAAYVASIESLRTWDALDELNDNPPDFDLVIVDEAHSMRNSDTKSYKLGVQLTEWTTGSNMVFLTATPINLHESDLQNLLGLLDPGDFQQLEDLELLLAPNAVINEVGKALNDKSKSFEDFDSMLAELNGLAFGKSVIRKPEFHDLRELLKSAPLSPKQLAIARRHMSKLNTLSSTITRTRRAEVDEHKTSRDAEPGIKIEWSTTESEFYQEFLSWCSARAAAAGTAMYFSMQMPIRLASTSLKLAAESVLHREPGLWKGDNHHDSDVKWVEPSQVLRELSQKVLDAPDTKLRRLHEVLANLYADKRQALLFTWSKATLKYLHEELGGNYRIGVLNGDVKKQDRRIILRKFREGELDFVFANKVASEGLDFEFCSAVINYDLPWNPMEVEQRIGRIDRFGQQSEKILIRNFYNDEAIDSRIMFKLLQRIHIFEKSIGELEPIIGKTMDELFRALDFTLSPEEQERRAEQRITALETQIAQARDITDSAAGIMISNDVEISGLENDLLRSGRYLGHVELAQLISDWAKTDNGNEVVWINDSKAIEIVGNPTMGGRVQDLANRGLRRQAEISQLISDLRNQTPIHLALSQELARTTELDLLSATHPLVVAASAVPGHSQARFASIRINPSEDVPRGRYLVLMAHAKNASRGGDAIWSTAIDVQTGASAGETVADAVLATLARGELRDSGPIPPIQIERLAKRARFEIEKRHEQAQSQRDIEDSGFLEQRKIIIAEQHERRMRGIERRMQTIVERDRKASVIRMVEGQLRRQENRYRDLLTALDNQRESPVSISYIAACYLEVEHGLQG